MRIVVLGASGMLGHKVLQVLRRRFPDTTGTLQYPPSRALLRALDLGDDEVRRVLHVGIEAMNLDELADLIRRARPDVVVNCIGIIKQRDQAKSPVPSLMLNALLPHRLYETQLEHGGRLIHISTDCVFSGKRGNYTEDDFPDAEDLYGRTKLLGEVSGPGAVTLRTSIIGREVENHQSLLDWFLAQEGRKIRGFAHAIYSGVTTNFLARFVSDVIATHHGLFGLYQVTADTIAKYDLLLLLREAFGVSVEIERDDIYECNRSMRGDRLRAAIPYHCPPWTELVRELADDPTPYEDWTQL